MQVLEQLVHIFSDFILTTLFAGAFLAGCGFNWICVQLTGKPLHDLFYKRRDK